MTNVQLEKGYTRIANELLEELAKMPLNGTQWRIILILWRNTYGYSRKQHELSESFISKATGISKRYISSELNRLIEMNVVKVIKASTYIAPKTLSFNKDYDSWGYGRMLPLVNENTTVEPEQHTTVEQLFNTTVEESFHQQRKILKKDINKGLLEEFFESIWKLYPKKEGKGQISKNQKQKLYQTGYEQIKRCIERYIKAKAGTDKQYLQKGSTFFNSGYIDYLDENQQQQVPVPKKIEIEVREFEA